MYLPPKTHEQIGQTLRNRSHSWVGSVYVEAFSGSDLQKQYMDEKHQEKMEINVSKSNLC